MSQKLGLLLLCSVLMVAPARGVDKEAIDAAIERGVTGLRRMQGENGSWSYSESGATSLAALTLLECGVRPDDPAIVKGTRSVRQASLREVHTYSLALAIIYLDRLGDPNDIPLIESLTVRLLAGQKADGGWSYQCPPINEQEQRRLTTPASQERVLVARRDAPHERHRTVNDLPLEIKAQLRQIQIGVAQQQMAVMGSDNSNTQFATLALWIARRHGLPVEGAIARIGHRFRQSQNADGGWSYTPPVGGSLRPGASTATMTCAGLLGLAVSDGSALETAKKKSTVAMAAKDANLRGGLEALASIVGAPVGDVSRAPQAGGASFYFLWSLERVAVILNLKTLGRKDWYSWGAEILLANQLPNGQWQGSYGTMGADTCFALLFLKRANFAEDLTNQLKGEIGDPGQAVLRGQGTRLGPGSESSISTGLEPKNAQARDSSPNHEAREGGNPALEEPHAPLTGLAAEMSRAEPGQIDALLATYRDGKGVKFTEELASAIPQLSGELKQRARHTLAERLTRMKTKTLAAYVADEEPEIRRATALAIAMKDAKALVPELIRLLDDPQRTVGRAAHAALKALTGKDFGPGPEASADEHRTAAEAWKAWWREEGERGGRAER